MTHVCMCVVVRVCVCACVCMCMWVRMCVYWGSVEEVADSHTTICADIHVYMRVRVGVGGVSVLTTSKCLTV